MTEVARIHPDEPAAVVLLGQAIKRLTLALDDMPIADVVAVKAQVTTIETATKQLGMSREAQEYATEAVRRSEWGVAMKIRAGQADGSIARQGHALNTVQHEEDVTPVAVPTDFASKGELYGARGEGLLGIADAAPTPEAFDAALEEAKAEGNLSRANVARKAREKAGTTPVRATPRRPLTVQFFDAAYDLNKVVERIDRLVNDDRFPQNAEKVGAKHRTDLLRAVELLSKALDHFTTN